MEDEHCIFRRYIQKPVSKGMGKVENTEKIIAESRFMLGEMCQTKNTVPFHPSRD
jgi:hypothetical protein